MRENLPRVEAKVNRDDKGMYIVNLNNLTKGCGNGNAKNNSIFETIATDAGAETDANDVENVF